MSLERYPAQLRARLRGWMEMVIDRGDGRGPRSMTQGEVARGLGITTSNLTRILTGSGKRDAADLTVERLTTICRLLAITPEQLQAPVMTPGRVLVLRYLEAGRAVSSYCRRARLYVRTKQRMVDMQTEGLIEPDGEGWAITDTGRVALRRYDDE